jgi:hypothetical protein
MTMTTMTTKTMATARRATKLTMMATTRTMATGNDNDHDGNSTMVDGAMGYDDDDNGDG